VEIFSHTNWLDVESMDRNIKANRATQQGRLQELRRRIVDNRLNGVILVPGPNLRYITGIHSMLLERPFLFFVPNDGVPHLVAPTLESGPYLRSPAKIIVHSWSDAAGPFRAFEELSAELQLNGNWGVEGRTPFKFIHQILDHAHPDLVDAEEILQNLRAVKEPSEVHALQRAAMILVKSFLKIPDMLKPGITESQLASRISQTVYSNGAEYVDDVLVQSGQFAADPHHLPSTRKLRRNESIVVDTASTYAGYYADITRTFLLGKNREFDSLYNHVLGSQEAAIEASQPGATVGSVDNAARNYLRQKDLDRYFIHRTGHGLGLEVHEAPYIVAQGKELLAKSMAFTIEPGVYLSGNMGIRIEDDVLTTDEGCEVLTRKLPKQLDWWK
jgi:Xaa-Pro dipeptidase